MTQPKTPPLSIRPGAERLERIDAYAAEHNLSRHLAIMLMLDEGHRALTAPTPAPSNPEQIPKPLTVKAKPAAKAASVEVPANPAKLTLNLPVASNAPAPYGSRLKAPKMPKR